MKEISLSIFKNATRSNRKKFMKVLLKRKAAAEGSENRWERFDDWVSLSPNNGMVSQIFNSFGIMEVGLPTESVKLYRPSEYSGEECSLDAIFQKYRLRMAHLNAPFKLYETNCSTSGDDESDDSRRADRKMRGPYRKYTFEEKLKAVERIIAGEDVKMISREFCIPRRNLLRWKKNGCERKEGGGRPTDSQMEQVIFQKIKNGQLCEEREIRMFAIELSKTSSFKASKGWFVKFCNRFNIRTDVPNGKSQYENIV